MVLAIGRAALLSSLAIALAGCGGAGRAGPARPGATARAKAAPRSAPVRRPPRGTARPMTFASCEAQPCMRHSGRGRYYQCLNAGGGLCFHYGAPCEPADQCMLDQASATYRKCQRARSGECLEFGAACEPGNRCAADPRDGTYHTCDQFADGKCQHFGAPCTPK